METVATAEVTLIRCRKDIEKSTWRTHRFFVDFESGIHVELSTSNRCQNIHVDSPLKIDEISTNFSTWKFDVESMANRRRCVHWAVLNKFVIFTGKQLGWSLFLIKFLMQVFRKETPTPILKNISERLLLIIENVH